jgi:hypothetical protein
MVLQSYISQFLFLVRVFADGAFEKLCLFLLQLECISKKLFRDRNSTSFYEIIVTHLQYTLSL